jgi:flagellar biosynthesis protein FliR
MQGVDHSAAALSTLLGPHLALGVFLLFCRIGGCLMLAPGFSSVQIPARIRLFIALAITLSLTPLLLNRIPQRALGDEPVTTLRFILSELCVGLSIGLLSRLFLVALETMAVASATGLGLANVFGSQFDQNDAALPPLASFITISATALIFVTDLHWEILRGILASYDAAPVTGSFYLGLSLRQLASLLASTFRIALQICSPFIVYAIIVNLAVSIINRLTPQIAIFYISAPFVIAGGLVLLYFTIKASLLGFMIGFSSWLTNG